MAPSPPSAASPRTAEDASVAAPVTPSNDVVATERRFSAVDYSGLEWVVDAFGCSADKAGSIETLNTLAARLIRDLDLHPAAPPLWRSFDGGGVTGLILLSESHFTCHSFPEMGFIAFNLYCCRQRSGWAWEQHVTQLFGATHVQVRELVRGAV